MNYLYFICITHCDKVSSILQLPSFIKYTNDQQNVLKYSRIYFIHNIMDMTNAREMERIKTITIIIIINTELETS